MLQQAYAVLLLVAFILNRKDRRMLALTAMVAVSVFIPPPRDTAVIFYTFCGAFEALVMFVALALEASASEVVASICIVLILAHIMGYAQDGYAPLSSYRAIVPILESVQILACVGMSPALYDRLRNREI